MMDKSPHILSSILKVKRTVYLSPHYIRITLTGNDVPLFQHTKVGANNKIFLPSNVDNQIYFDQKKSIRRTYTGVAMKNKTSDLYPKADWYLLVGDATGIPVLATILESLPPTAKGIAFIEVLNKEEEIPLSTSADIQINWVYNNSPGEKFPLVTAVKNAMLPDNNKISCFGYVATEFTTTKEVRHYLRKDKGWKKEELYAYAYWKFGKSEELSTLERQEERTAHN